MPAIDFQSQPYSAFNFRLEFDGIAIAAFSEVSGLTADGDSTDYREGTDKLNLVRKLPGLRKVVAIVAMRGYTQDDTLWQWYERIARGIDDRRNGSIVLMNAAHRDVIRWNFESGFPNRIEGPALKATDNAVAIERFEIIHQRLTMELEPAPAPAT